MEKDLPGGSSLLGSSVWSMHPTAAAPPPPTQPTRPQNEPFFVGNEGPSAHDVERRNRNAAIDQGLNRPPPGLVKENTVGSKIRL